MVEQRHGGKIERGCGERDGEGDGHRGVGFLRPEVDGGETSWGGRELDGLGGFQDDGGHVGGTKCCWDVVDQADGPVGVSTHFD